jgi:CDP-diacylglycerol--glycerol-3-phosphate 3-phosphatidyltransferase
MRLNLPNSLTVLRIFLVPLLVVVLLTPPWATVWIRARVESADSIAWIGSLVEWLGTWREIVAVGIFLVAAATDWLDGYLARSRGQVTTLGKLLDPIADKLLTTSAFIALVELRLAPAWMIVVIVGREFVVSGMRAIAASHGWVMAASRWGKYKTASQVVAIVLLILTHRLDGLFPYGNLGVLSLWVVLVLALVSMIHYLYLFLKTVDLGAEA